MERSIRTITSLDWKTYPVFAFGEPLLEFDTVILNPFEVRELGHEHSDRAIVTPILRGEDDVPGM